MTRDDAVRIVCETGIRAWQQFGHDADERGKLLLERLMDGIRALKEDHERASDERDQRLRNLKRGDAIRHRVGAIGVVEYNAVEFRELLVVFRGDKDIFGNAEDHLNLCGYDWVELDALPAPPPPSAAADENDHAR